MLDALVPIVYNYSCLNNYTTTLCMVENILMRCLESRPACSLNQGSTFQKDHFYLLLLEGAYFAPHLTIPANLEM